MSNDTEFRVIEGNDGRKNVLFDSSRASACCDFILKNKIYNISLYPGIYKAKDLEGLLPLKGILRGLVIGVDVSYKDLHQFKNLTMLSAIDNKKDILNLSEFPFLKELVCSWTKRLFGLEKCVGLELLSINNYNPESKNFLDIPNLPYLKKIYLFFTKITSLQGIGRFPLESLSIFRAPKLNDISDIKDLSNTLEFLEIESADKIENFESLANLNALRKMILVNSGEINSLGFVKGMDALKFFSFVGTNIADGDLTPLKKIEYVGFNDKKHYNLKFKEFENR